MITVKTKVFFNRAAHGRKTIDTKPAARVAVDPGRVPRISRLMALAIHFDEMIRAGKVANISEIARLTHVTQPRITQLMNLCHLAPDIQEEILFLPLVMSGRDPIHEHMLRAVTACADWREQRRAWGRVRAGV
jgi:hypothetical protein